MAEKRAFGIPARSRQAGSWLVAAAVVLGLLSVADARPLVRNVKTNTEFKKLLKHHAENTGLPVVVDFYSDGCGPCRQVTPRPPRHACCSAARTSLISSNIPSHQSSEWERTILVQSPEFAWQVSRIRLLGSNARYKPMDRRGDFLPI